MKIKFDPEYLPERHRRQERKMETIVRESRPVKLEGVVKSQVSLSFEVAHSYLSAESCCPIPGGLNCNQPFSI